MVFERGGLDIVMKPVVQLQGQKFGRLLVIDESERIKDHRRWNCVCDCGNKVTVYQTCLMSGNTQSCGCLCSDVSRERLSVHGENNRNSRLHSIWNCMFDRCRNSNNPRYKDYGGRGISVCSSWTEYLSFKKWTLENGYSDDLTLDRIEVNGNYCPENCRWATHLEQQNNMRSNTLITFNGKTLTLAQWSREIGVQYGTLVARWSRGWNVERMLTTPNQKKGDWSTKSVREK